MTKNLVIYYSRRGENYVNGNIAVLKKGNTEIAVQYIAEALQADVFEIKPLHDYAEDYTECVNEAKKEAEEKARPALKEYLDSIAGYENIVIAGPCWCGTYPMPVFSQLERLDFAGKKVFPVMSNEGSGLGHCVSDLAQICQGAKIGSGLSIHGSDTVSSEAAIQKWVKENIEN
jgi:flavodoxin